MARLRDDRDPAGPCLVMALALALVLASPSAAQAPGGVATPGTGTTTTQNPQALGRVNRVVFRGTDEEIASIERLLHQYDRLPREVLLEMYILDVNIDRNDSVGVNFNSFFGAARPLGELPTGAYSFDRRLTDFDQQIKFGSLSTERFQIFMQYLKNMTDTRLLNRPSALVLDGGTAVVNLGGQLRYLSRVNVTVTGTAGTTVRAPVTETLDTGQNLRITPRIMPNDIILLSMTFDDTALQNFQTFGQGDTAVTLPQTTRRAMSMPMFVKNGAAVIIGGLKNQRKDRSSAKIPLLSEVPFLGRNFGRNQKRNQSNELVVVVKATAIAAEDF